MNVDVSLKNVWPYQTAIQTFVQRNVAIKSGKFYYIHEEENVNLQPKKTINAENQWMIPGSVDAHMHIESSMTAPIIFSKTAVRYGVTTVIADAHEMTDVFGLGGLKALMAVEAKLDILHAIPSSVPSTIPELEIAGRIIDLAEVIELLKEPEVICLGEVMNFKGIPYEPDSLIRRIIDLC